MNKIEYALRLAKDCTYADEMTGGAKEHLRNVIDEALKEASLLPKDNLIGAVCEHQTEKYGKCLKCGEQIFNQNYDNE